MKLLLLQLYLYYFQAAAAMQATSSECSGELCNDRGVCSTTSATEQKCDCRGYYSGDQCELCGKDKCDSGDCVMESGDLKCKCTDGGESCFDVNSCISSSCVNGECVKLDTGDICLCPLMFTGTICVVELNVCSSQPCVHGLCNDDWDHFSCTCFAGYTDSTCSSRIDCKGGLNGGHCQEDISDCQSQPCFNGHCMELVDGYFCSCASGFTGELCQTEVHECNSYPCTDGICIDGIDSYTCSCFDGLKFNVTGCDSDSYGCAGESCETGICVILSYSEHVCVDINSILCDANYTGLGCESNLEEPLSLLSNDSIDSLSTVTKELADHVETPLPTAENQAVTGEELNMISLRERKTTDIQLSAGFLKDQGNEKEIIQSYDDQVTEDTGNDNSYLAFDITSKPDFEVEQSLESGETFAPSFDLEQSLDSGETLASAFDVEQSLESGETSGLEDSTGNSRTATPRLAPTPSFDLGDSTGTVTADVLSKAIDGIARGFQNLLEKLENMSFNELDESLGIMFKDVGKVLESLTLKNEVSDVSEDDKISLLRKVRNLIHDMLDAVTNSLKLGDELAKQLPELDFVISKCQENEIRDKNLSSDVGKISFPSPIFENARTSNSCVELQAVFYRIHPYHSVSNTDDHNVVYFDLRECSNQNQTKSIAKRFIGDFLGTVAKDYILDLMKPDIKEQMVLVRTSLEIPDVFSITKKVAVEENLQVRLEPVSAERLNVYVDFNMAPTNKRYWRHFIASKDVNNQTFLISKKDLQLHNADTLALGVQQICYTQENKGSNCSRQLHFNYFIGGFQCSSWNEEMEHWKALNECRVAKESKNSQTMQPGKYGPVASTIFIPPNAINLKMIQQRFKENTAMGAIAVTLSFLMLALFFFVLLVLRKQDEKDRLSWQVVSLPNDRLTDDFLYEVHIHTGQLKGKAIECIISIVLHGSEGYVGKRQLVQYENTPVVFDKNSVNSFVFSSSINIGEVEKIEIYFSDDSIQDQQWFLNFVVVVTLSDMQYYPFFCKRWVNRDTCQTVTDNFKCVAQTQSSNSENKVDETCMTPIFDDTVRIVLSESENEITKKKLLKKNLANALLEGHLWISSFYVRVKTTFSRVQRWVCCVFAVMGFMLFDAMWFDTSFGADSATFNVGKMKINVRSFITMIYSTILVSLTTSVLAIVYAKTNVSKKEENMRFMTYAPISQMRNYTVLPHYMIFIAHGVAFSCIVASQVVCTLYLLQWGPDIALIWLFAVCFSILCDILIWQPLLIIPSIAYGTLRKEKDTDMIMYQRVFDIRK